MPFLLEPLLQTQLDLYSLPRGQERFDRYLATAIGNATCAADVLRPHLLLLNPMARPHVRSMLEAYQALGAERAVERVLGALDTRLGVDAAVHVGIVAVDDSLGGWTHGQLTDFQLRFGPLAMHHGGITLVVPLWTTRAPSLEELERAALECAHRTAHKHRHGVPKTLREMMVQEGGALAFAGRAVTLDAHELEYSRQVIAPALDSSELPVQFSCLYGDEAARAVGYASLGLSPQAGFQVALANAGSSSASGSVSSLVGADDGSS